MKKLTNIIALIILVINLLFHLWLNFPETRIMADPNDNIFQYALIYRTDWVWENYNCPLSLSCLPNLIDHNVTAWAEGYPLPFYYSHIPQIATVSTYRLLIRPVSSLFGSPLSLYEYYNWTKYLLLCLFPIPVFLALRIVGFSAVTSSIAAIFASHFSTDGLYGIDPPSYLWRGWGLTSQLYGFIFMPIALAYTFKLMRETTRNLTMGEKIPKYTWLKAAVFMTLTTAGHLGMGMLGLISTVPFLLLDFKIRNILGRLKKMMYVYIFTLFSLSYWIAPMLLANNYHIISFWDPIWKFNSYGWYEVVRQFWGGEIFDWKRSFPIITFIVLTGFFTLLSSETYLTFAFLFVMWVLFYFGRTTWGGLIDLIPGMKDYHLHRFVVTVQIAAIFLIPGAIELFYNTGQKAVRLAVEKIILVAAIIKSLKKPNVKPQTSNGATNNNKLVYARLHIYSRLGFFIFSGIILAILWYYTALQTVDYASFNNRWIDEANSAYRFDEENFLRMVEYLKKQPQSRIYAGRPGNWGHQFRLGSSQIYMLMATSGFDTSQFLPETWSPLSENEQNFDERVERDYDLLNIRYVVADKNHEFPKEAKMEQKFGPFEVYSVPTSGWFTVVSSPMMVRADKTNFINIVHQWHRSFPREWNMHPVISVEKKSRIPPGVKRVIKMKDEVNYVDITKTTSEKGLKLQNIWADFPFVFPAATASGQIVNESVAKQIYSGRVKVPDNCEACRVMFKMSYHPNWEAKVDGKEVEKSAVFPFYLSVPVSPGEHTVEFSYKPSRLKISLLVVELIILLALAGFLIKRKYFRKQLGI